MNKIFYKSYGLKKFSSILLLFVFVIGITPKKTFHLWFANHKDSTSKIPVGNTQQLSKAGFNCVCDDLVAEPHFIGGGNFAVINIPGVCSLVPLGNIAYITLSHFLFNLRGPPLKF